MALSGLKRGLTVAFFAGGLFAASFAFPGKAESAAVSPGDARHPAETDVYYDDEAVSPDAPGHTSRADTTTNEQTMLASYYGRSLEGRPTASGEPFDADAYTAAHKSLPLGTRLRVNHGGETVQVTVNDRGPYVAGRDIDLSLAAAREIGLTYPGTAPVQVVVL
ncbi:MAG: septal ring lytic transglycosylase RlpA family protein [Actinomycetota bacterium]|nr:septal ring lytic transglycosylase RlpA family protein [Actinomycetota bacterium]